MKQTEFKAKVIYSANIIPEHLHLKEDNDFGLMAYASEIECESQEDLDKAIEAIEFLNTKVFQAK